jgi:glucose/arabinose dehydrogenase
MSTNTLDCTNRRLRLAYLAGLAIALMSCAQSATQSPSASMGANPNLPAPEASIIPTVNIAPAKGWSAGAMPQAAPGTRITAFARGLNHPRWLYVLPNGDVLVAESNAPQKPEGSGGIRAWLMGLVMARAGAAVPSPDRITLLRDTDHDGIADFRSVLLEGLHSPFGMALVGNQLFVANTDALLRFTYTTGDTRILDKGIQVTALAAGPINHHWTKGLLASADGRKLLVSVGSNSNAAESGMAVEAERAAIWVVDAATGAHQVFASGLRNPVGMAWEPHSGALWVVVNERDELGNDLVPDYLTSVCEGGFYGWPYSYFGQNLDPRVKPQRPDLAASAIAPDYALGSHVAPLGLASSVGTSLPAAFADGMFVGLHGSWNRRPHSGYKVVFVPFKDGKPTGAPPVDVLTGFLSPEGDALGRPVGVALDTQGALLVADDVGNTVWRVSGGRKAR